jgi:hypothetical protein
MRGVVLVSCALVQANLFNDAIANQRPINLRGLILPLLINLNVAKNIFTLTKKPTRAFDDRVTILASHVEQPSNKGVNPLIHRLAPRARHHRVR